MKTIFTSIFNLFLLGSVMVFFTQSASAQQTTYSQEDSAVSTSELKRVYRYITRANVEEKTLIKLGFWPNPGERGDYTGRPSFRIGLNSDISIERKITPSFSVLAGFDLMIRYNSFNPFAIPYDYGYGQYLDSDKVFRGFLYGKVGARYYYGMSKRIQQGKSANNFSGNYVGMQFSQALLVQVVQHYYDTRTGESVRTDRFDDARSHDAPLISAMWGIQRRLGRRGFVDINAGPELTIPPKSDFRYFIWNSIPLQVYKNSNRTSLSLRVNAVIGLGW